jgi:putative phosphoesterase
VQKELVVGGNLTKIIVLSDTHCDSIDSLPGKLVNELSAADLMIHAGDFTSKRLIDDLRKLNRLRGVYGNIDGSDVRIELPEIDIVEAEGFRIGLNHPAEGGTPITIEQRLRRKFQDVQAIIHGHSHRTKNEMKDGILWFNPGSATGKFPALKKSYGVLTLDREVRGEIVDL